MKKSILFAAIGLVAILAMGGVASAHEARAKSNNSNNTPVFHVMPYVRYYGAHRGYIVGQVAKFLKMEPGQLRKELMTGKTLNQILIEKNVTKEALHAKVTETVKSWLDKQVAAGRMTAARETELMTKFEAQYNAHIDQILSMKGNELLKWKMVK